MNEKLQEELLNELPDLVNQLLLWCTIEGFLTFLIVVSFTLFLIDYLTSMDK